VKLLKRLLIALVLCANSLHAEEKMLNVGAEMNFPPFEMLDAKGQPAGVSIEMATALGQSLHRPVRFQNIPFEGLIPSLKTGKVDLVISSMSVTEDRKKSIDFSDPYLKMGLSILAGKNSDIQSIDDVDKSGHSVAVKKATTGHIYAMQHFKNAKLLVLNEDATCATEVAQGKADCFIYDQVSIFQHWQKYKDVTRAILNPFQTEEWAIGIQKGNDSLRQQVNSFLKEFKGNGGFDKIGEKYFSENKKAFAELGVPFYF
jgi:polar amino acid transport system substrate-binding protein